MAAVTHAHPVPALYAHAVRRTPGHSVRLFRAESLAAAPFARAVLAGNFAEPAMVRVAFLSLFHPRLLEVTGQAQTLRVRWASGDRVDVQGPGEEHRELGSLTLSMGRFSLHVVGRHTESQVPSVSVMTGSKSGQGRGHGIGLCQRGAVALATEGRTAGEILAHYFPNTAVATLP